MTAHVLPPANADLDQARRFLSKALPWPENDESYVDVIWSEAKKPLWSGRAVRTLDEAIDVLAWISSRSGRRDIYVCMSSQRIADEKTSKKGNKYLAPIRNQQNVVALKSLYLDIDFKGGDHGYDTPDDAINALAQFLKDAGLPRPSMIVKSGGGLHIHFTVSRALGRAEWQPLANALAEAGKHHGLKADYQVTTDSARLLRIPGTQNNKQNTPRPVTLRDNFAHLDCTVESLWQALEPFKVALLPGREPAPFLDPALFPPRAPLPDGVGDELAAGIERRVLDPIHLDDLAVECGFIRDAIKTGGLNYSNPMWNLTTLLAAFTDDPRSDAHRMGAHHPGYTKETTDDLLDRKVREKEERGLGFPRCATISGAGCKACQSCQHITKGRSPLAALPRSVTAQAEAPSFADPYADFVGPAFPASILPPVLADFVEAQHRSMGADPAALAMATLTAVAGALNAESKIQIGEGWSERPIVCTVLVGPPSVMKSPIIDKVIRPLRKADADRDASWRLNNAAWEQSKAAGMNPGPRPAKPTRCVIQDATPETVAEILSRGPCGALMMQDELAGWFGSFERYNSGSSSRAFYLSCWNGGPFLKDRVGQGVRDENAEIRVDNLALGILGGIQPDRLSALRDITSDGLLQRFLPVLMRPAERGNERYPVTAVESEYARLLQSVLSALPRTYTFAPDAEEVRKRVLDRLYELEQVDGFALALIGAIGKLKAYFARLSLVLHVSGEYSALARGHTTAVGAIVSRETAEAAEKLVFDFLLPHIFGLYDVVANGGQDRDTVRAIADFTLASAKDRLRPSDFSAGVRRLRGEPTNKIAEWASRFIAMGWLRPDDERLTTPKAWFVEPGLRTHFAARRRAAQAARAAAHAILKAGGSRR